MCCCPVCKLLSCLQVAVLFATSCVVCLCCLQVIVSFSSCCIVCKLLCCLQVVPCVVCKLFLVLFVSCCVVCSCCHVVPVWLVNLTYSLLYVSVKLSTTTMTKRTPALLNKCSSTKRTASHGPCREPLPSTDSSTCVPSHAPSSARVFSAGFPQGSGFTSFC